MYRLLLQNHALTNLTFLLVVALGVLAYTQLPRAQDPQINLGWAEVFTTLPGATPQEVEEKITTPLEEGIEQVKDIRFFYSNSRQDSSLIAIRFEDLDEDVYQRRLSDLRREIQNQLGELPDAASQPRVREITSSNLLPAAMLLVVGVANDENLRKQAKTVAEALERLPGVERVGRAGQQDPELQVRFNPDRLVGLGTTPTALADTVTAYFRDLSAGTVNLEENGWLVRVAGTDSDPDYLSELPILTAMGEVPLQAVADVRRAREEAQTLVEYQGQPAVMLLVFKEANANILEVLERLRTYIGERNELAAQTGVDLTLLHDKTPTIKRALSVMERNALVGLLLVLVVTGIVLGWRIAVFTTVGMVFVLAGTFGVVSLVGETMNVIVLLGLVIALGMLVDDAVVVVEAFYHHRQKVKDRLEAAIQAMREVATPVTTAVLTTIAAFLPLMLVPGVVGQYMRVAPFVLATALLLSLVEAFWILPSHMVGGGPRPGQSGRFDRWRAGAMHWLRRRYTRLLLPVMRRPLAAILVGLALVGGSVGSIGGGLIAVDFFASDAFRFFYINIKMPTGTPLEKTLATASRVDRLVRAELGEQTLRESGAYAGIMFTDMDTRYGDQFGQVFVSLKPQEVSSRPVNEIVESLRAKVNRLPGPSEVSFLQMQTGPPTGKPISIKVRGDDYLTISEAVARITDVLQNMPGVADISSNDNRGRIELAVRLNPDAVRRADLEPTSLIRAVRLMVDGQVVASMRNRGEELDVRVIANSEKQDLAGLLQRSISLPDGNAIALAQLLYTDLRETRTNLRHYDGRRAVTVEAEIDPTVINTVEANQQIKRAWQALAAQYPDIDLDFTGAQDDIKESVGALGMLFLVGVGLIYLILSTQFSSYLQPLVLLSTVPLAFVGVVIGLLVSGNPLSVYTLYGIVALAGISINDAIVLLTAANQRVALGMPVGRATVYAARRRVVPILITTITTVAGLFSLATGLAGHSLMWGPLATAIVWGLVFATGLSLFIIPVLNSLVARAPQTRAEGLLQTVLHSGGGFRGLQNTLTQLVSGGRFGNTRVPQAIRDDPTLAAQFKQGVNALVDGDLETAIRHFDDLSQTRPEDADCHIHAANAIVIWLMKNGYDGGYMRRARRHLRQAKQTAPDDQRIAELEEHCDKLEEGAGMS